MLNYTSLRVFAHTASAGSPDGRGLEDVPTGSRPSTRWWRRATGCFPELEAHYVYFPKSGPSDMSSDFIKVSGRAPGAGLLGASSYVTFAVSPVIKVLGHYDARQASWAKKLLMMTATGALWRFCRQRIEDPVCHRRAGPGVSRRQRSVDWTSPATHRRDQERSKGGVSICS